MYDTTQHDAVHHLLSKKKLDRSQDVCETEVYISQRENEVLVLLAEGLSSKQIAHQLYISTQTVFSHRKHLIEKFKVRNTPQLISKAGRLHRLGIFYEIKNP